MNWFNNLKISSKINLISGSIIIITFIIFGYVLLDNVYHSSIDDAKKIAVLEAEIGANIVERRFQTIVNHLYSLKDIIEQERNQEADQRNIVLRKEVIKILNLFLENNPDVFGFCTAWEPEAFDGKDKEYINKEYHDSTGRFIPYVVRFGEKIITVPLKDYNIAEWYLLPKKLKKLVIIDPFYYPVNDKQVRMFSIILPILDKSHNFIGIITSDIQIDDLQELTKKIIPLGGYSFIISEDGNYIAHSLRPELLTEKKQDLQVKYKEAIKANKLGKYYAYIDKSTATGKKVLRVFQPIHFEGTDKIWSLCICVPQNKILENYYFNLRLICLAIVVLVIMIVMINILIVSNVISKPLFYIVDVLNKLARGDFDFKIEQNNSLDEIGDLHRSAELLQKDLSNFIMDLQTKEEELIAQNEELYLAEKELQKERNSLEIKVKERTNELKESLDRLEKANNHKSNFLSTMSHELRTPLNAIIGFSDLLRKQYYGELNEKQIEYTELILNSSNHLLDLINDILDITKIDSGTIELDNHEVNIHNLVNEVQSLMLSQFNEKGIHLSCFVDDELKLIILDERKFKQILINLLSNALKFTENGERVEVNVLKLNDRQFKVSIKDTGIGIDNDEKDKIFDKFYQITNKNYKVSGGTGLGLTIVKRFVAIQGGEIFVESEPGKGSNFWFILPLN